MTEDLPAYRTIPEYRTVLAGTNHFASYRSDSRKKERFLGEVRRANHLIVEGDRNLTNFIAAGLPATLTKTNYETLAITSFREGDIHPLEGQEDMVALAKTHGCRPDLFTAYYILCQLGRKAVRHASSVRRITESEVYRLILTGLKARMEPYRNMRVNDAARALGRILHDPTFKDTDSILESIGLEFLWFEKRLREEEVMSPKARELCTGLRGNKLVIVGYYHLDSVEKHIKGEPTEPAPTWQQVIETAEPAVRDAILRIENELVPLE